MDPPELKGDRGQEGVGVTGKGMLRLPRADEVPAPAIGLDEAGGAVGEVRLVENFGHACSLPRLMYGPSVRPASAPWRFAQREQPVHMGPLIREGCLRDLNSGTADVVIIRRRGA